MSYVFPDAVAGIAELVDQLGTVAFILREDWQGDPMPVLHVYRAGGSVSGIERMDRVIVDTYALGLADAYAAAGAVQTLLDGRWHAPSAGLLDSVTTEVVPTAMQVDPAEHLSLVRATYRVAARPLPA